MNTLKLLFPEGCEITPAARKPVHQSCFITVSDDSLDVHMLTFIKYSEKTSDAFAHEVAKRNPVRQMQLPIVQRSVYRESNWIHF